MFTEFINDLHQYLLYLYRYNAKFVIFYPEFI